MRTYSELVSIPSFEDRIRYLQTLNSVGMYTYGGSRSLNQSFYHSSVWRDIRRKVILRDDGCDLAHPDYPIAGRIYIHHLNPIDVDDIVNFSEALTDLENLVCVSFDTHQMIHYSKDVPEPYVERKPGDTVPWR